MLTRKEWEDRKAREATEWLLRQHRERLDLEWEEYQATLTPLPADGLWVRKREHPRPRATVHTTPEWRGLWHLSTGRLDSRASGGDRAVKTLCGHSVSVEYRAHDECMLFDCIAIDERPTVDVCGQCVRLAGIALDETPRKAKAPHPIPLSEDEARALRILHRIDELGGFDPAR